MFVVNRSNQNLKGNAMTTKTNRKTTPPIKRHEAIVQFSREHHFGLLLSWKIREGIRNNIEPERIGSYVICFFEQDLQKHFRDEESILFPKLGTDDVLKQQAIREHKKICALADSIRNEKNGYALLNSFADALENHIRFEERDLFRHIQESLTESDLAEIQQAHGIKKIAPVDDNWSDHFWESGNQRKTGKND